ncbi:MAG TPA: hypothetical protein VK208_21935 [Pyrinomonadaceae bacterium]|jgi:hypothetical protein|nr:hypothetical protein [Pyrinomonadaceae bacterium]
MKSLFAMRRANGDWYAVDDLGSFRVPIFHTSGQAMIARSRDARMECFRPVVLDVGALKNLTTTDEGKACFWLVADPLMKLSRSRPLDRGQLEEFMKNGKAQTAKGDLRK